MYNGPSFGYSLESVGPTKGRSVQDDGAMRATPDGTEIICDSLTKRLQQAGTRHWNSASALLWNRKIPLKRFSQNFLWINVHQYTCTCIKIQKFHDSTKARRGRSGEQVRMGGRSLVWRWRDADVNQQTVTPETRSTKRLAFTNATRVYTSHIRRDLIRRSQVKVAQSPSFNSIETHLQTQSINWL